MAEPKYAPAYIVDLKYGSAEPEITIKPLEIWEIQRREQDTARALEQAQVAVEEESAQLMEAAESELRKALALETVRSAAASEDPAVAGLASAVLELLKPTS